MQLGLGTAVAVPFRSPLGRTTRYLLTYYGSTGNHNVLHRQNGVQGCIGMMFAD